jgi:hypothetical protein
MCIVKKKPEHLWDYNTQTFITEGHERFTALLDIHIIPWRGLLPTDRELEKVELSGTSSRYIAVLGLNALDRNMLKEDPFRKHLEPWAAIYERRGSEGGGAISRIVSEEDDPNFPDVVFRISTHLRSHFSHGRVLPLSLALASGREREFGQGHALNDSELQLSLAVSTQLETNNSSMYKLILKLEPTSA